MILSDMYLWLSYTRIPTPKLNRILSEIRIEHLWTNLSDDWNRYTLDDRTFAVLKRTHSLEYLERVKQYLATNNISYVTRADPLYPKLIDQAEVNPPPVLYYKGDLSVIKKPCLAVVGTRHATQYGKYVVQKLVPELSKEFTIVSGLATGIDGFAHASALDSGGTTAAVLGSGLFNVTPTSNLALFDRICKEGVAITEYTPDEHATQYTFPARNRIISGLCKGVLVIEAATDSGSLITANCALDQNRDVFAVPGDIDKIRSQGTNNLIKRGAIPVTSAKDIFDYYDIKTQKQSPHTVELDFNEQMIVDALATGEKSFDELAVLTKLSVSELNTAISTLLIFSIIHEKAHNVYCIS